MTLFDKNQKRTYRATRATVRLLSLTAFAMGTLFLSPQAHAGFEWTPPPVTPQNTGPTVQAVPVPAVNTVPAYRDDITAEELSSDGLTINENPFNDATAVTASVLPVSDDREYTVIEGFGRDIPLALVMQQIVPAGYAYSFETGIDPGTRVSWDGNQPWNIALQDAVTPLGMHVIVSDMTVWLRPGNPGDKDIGMMTVAGQQPGPPVDDMTSMNSTAMENVMSMITDTPDDMNNNMPQTDFAAIGRRNESDYSPSYPRRIPIMVSTNATDTPATSAPQTLSPFPGETSHAASVPDAEPATQKNAGIQYIPPQSTPMPAMQPPAPAAATTTAARWQAQKDDSLHDTLQQWAAAEGITLYWDVGGDYRVPQDVHAHGAFTDAVMDLLYAYGKTPDSPVGKLYQGAGEAAPVLVIRSGASAQAVN